MVARFEASRSLRVSSTSIHSIWALHTIQAIYHVVKHGFGRYLLPVFAWQTHMAMVEKRKRVWLALDVMLALEETKEVFWQGWKLKTPESSARVDNWKMLSALFFPVESSNQQPSYLEWAVYGGVGFYILWNSDVRRAYWFHASIHHNCTRGSLARSHLASRFGRVWQRAMTKYTWKTWKYVLWSAEVWISLAL